MSAWTPAQIAALAFGVWWAMDGALAFAMGNPSPTAPGTQGQVDLLGTSIAVNGWHGFLHLITGLGGLAVCARATASRVYAIFLGAAYLLLAASGFVAGGPALGVVYVDALGSVVHAVEGAIVLAAGVVSAPSRTVRQV